ncbi:MAG: DNA-binding protein [Sphingomonadales bacterium]|nr:DNA-binding protein [Sphingomonadales bacterium]
MSVPRPLPVLDRDTEAFWTGGANGELLIERCGHCHYLIHPPTGFCPKCESRDTAPHAVSGRATIISCTVNHKQWMPNLPVPYVLALVALDEQADVQLATNIVDCAPEAAYIGMKVRVRFEQVEDLWVPLFAPAESGA